ncbi:MAG: TetR/AcrR family transcriptional regulator [Candidatus Dormibacteraeota bacterium]|nr:TetR/AcrR family transcriptional regulator [Candidatus Dormibacteraeota bacterium]
MARRTTAPRATAGTREDRARALVAAAYNQIADRGFEGLRTREVAAEVGLNIATLHYYFPTKEALIRGVLEHAMERFRSTLAPHGSAATQLPNHLRAVRRLLREEPRLGAVMSELALRSARDPAIAGLLDETYRAWHQLVRGLLRRAAREGHLRSDFESDDMAALILATLSNLTVPTMGGAARADRALRQLMRLLDLPNDSRNRKGAQATD